MNSSDSHRVRAELERAKRQSRNYMASMEAQKKALRTAERELKRKNAELNNLLDAIKRGEIDTLYGTTTESGAVSIQDAGLVVQNEQLMRNLKSSNHKFSEIFEHCYDGIMIIDCHGDILDINPKVELMWGLGRKDILKLQITNFHLLGSNEHSSSQFRHFETAEKQPRLDNSKLLQHTFENSPDTNIEIQLSDKCIVELRLAHIKWDEKDVYLATLHDITSLKKLMSVLTDSNEELERFAYVCSHDLQEPLRMIRCFSDKLETHLEADLQNDAKGQKYLGFISDGAERAQNLISDILAYSSINNNTENLQIVSTAEIVDEIENEMREALDLCGGEITCENLPDVQGNKTQLHQLFQNLINNAIKYQSVGNAPKIHLLAVDAGRYWKFSINDNGIGMAQRHIGRIFDVFQRLHNKSEYAGTGIGLSICKKVVERHSGTLQATSQPGVGSTFSFTLLKPTSTT